MAKKRRGRPPGRGRKAQAAGSFSSMVGSVAAKMNSWVAQRDEIATELQNVISRAQGMLAGLGKSDLIPPSVKTLVAKATGTEAPTRKRRTMSADARRRISEAQKARWAKQKGEATAAETVASAKTTKAAKKARRGR